MAPADNLSTAPVAFPPRCLEVRGRKLDDDDVADNVASHIGACHSCNQTIDYIIVTATWHSIKATLFNFFHDYIKKWDFLYLFKIDLSI